MHRLRIDPSGFQPCNPNSVWQGWNCPLITTLKPPKTGKWLRGCVVVRRFPSISSLFLANQTRFTQKKTHVPILFKTTKTKYYNAILQPHPALLPPHHRHRLTLHLLRLHGSRSEIRDVETERQYGLLYASRWVYALRWMLGLFIYCLHENWRELINVEGTEKGRVDWWSGFR